jgi:hypothetical protein
MHDSLSVQLSELAGYASDHARLDTPAAVRQHGTRRGWRRRGGAALLGLGIVAGGGAVVGIAHSGVTGPDAARAPASSASSVQLTAYQTTVLAKAHVTKAQVATLARSGFTAAQISALADATAHLTPQQKKALTTARIAAGYLAHLTPAERAALFAALDPDNMAQQIAAIAEARLSAAQLAALAAG